MSTYDDASLVMIPSGYKTGTVFSQKPMSTDGQLAFTRSNDTATRVASNGLIEKVRTNVALYSEDQTAWTLQIETSVTANAAANPLNGAVTADKVIPSAVTADHYRGLSMGSMIGEISSSIYVKADGYSIIDYGIYNATAGNYPVRAVFDLSTETITHINGSISSITSVGSGWYRISVTASAASTSAIQIYHRVRPSGTSGTYSGNGTSGMLLWGCQLESGVTTPYIGPTLGTGVSVGPVANVPRLDYLNTTCPRLLLEPQRTNLLQFSEQFDNSAWIKDASTITANAAISPDGYTNADKLFETATTDFHRVYGPTISVTSGTTYTASIFVKAAEVTTFAMELRLTSNVADATFNLVAGTASGVGVIQDYGNGWYRCILTGTATATGGGRPMFFIKQRTSYAGNASNGLLIYGAQFEVGSYVSSYVNTLAASVTRGADACSKTGISSLIGQTEGTLFLEFDYNQPSPDVNGRLLQVYATNDTTNAIVPLIFGAGANVNQFQLTTFSGGGTAVAITASSATVVPFGRQKFAIAYNAGAYTIYRNGSLFASGSGLVPASLTAMDLGGSSFATRNLSNTINQVLLFKTRLPNSELASLTTL